MGYNRTLRRCELISDLGGRADTTAKVSKFLSRIAGRYSERKSRQNKPKKISARNFKIFSKKLSRRTGARLGRGERPDGNERIDGTGHSSTAKALDLATVGGLEHLQAAPRCGRPAWCKREAHREPRSRGRHTATLKGRWEGNYPKCHRDHPAASKRRSSGLPLAPHMAPQ